MNLVGVAIVETVATRRDNTVKVVLGTSELGAEKSGALMAFANKEVKFLISDTHINQEQVEVVDGLDVDAPKRKTPSSRLRAVLFRVFENTNVSVDFDMFYKSEMEKIISDYKSKLQPA